METWLNGGVGRALGGYDEMYFRSIIAEDDRLFSVVGLETEGSTTDFQIGTNAYLYGTRFVNYLAYQYGIDSLFRFYNRTADSRRFFASQFKKVYGNSLPKVWKEWTEFEKENQKKNIERIEEYPLTPTEEITEKPKGSMSPLLYDSSRNVVYTAVNYPGRFARIVSISLETGKEKTLAKVDGPMLYQTTYLAYDPNDDRLFFSSHNSKIRGLQVYDLKTGRKRTAMKYTRTCDLVYDPVRNRLYGIRNNDGVSTLIYFDKDLKQVTSLYTFPFGWSVSGLTVSHSGQLLALTLFGVRGEQSLIRFDVDRLENAELVYDTLATMYDTDLSRFSFSLDDSKLYGSSYYTGVSNIWSVDAATGDMNLHSNVTMGLFAPVEMKKDTLLALRFERNGMMPVKVGVTTLHDAAAITYLGQEVFERNPELEKLPVLDSALDHSFQKVYNKIEDYHPFTKLRFAGAFPDITGYKNTIAVGYRLMFQDKIGLHRLNFYLGLSPWSHNPIEERFHFNLYWSFWGWSVDAYYNNSSFYDIFGPFKVSRAGYKVGLNYKWQNTLQSPFTWGWSAGIATYGMMDALPLFQNIASPVSELQTANANIEISKLRTSLGGVMPEAGYRFSLRGYTYFADRTFFPQLYFEYDQGFLLPVARNTSFWLRTMAGQSFGDPESAFGNDYFGGFRNNYVDRCTPYQYRRSTAFPGADIDAIEAHSFAKAMAELNLQPIRFNNFGFMGLYPTYAQLSIFSSYLLAGNGKKELGNYVNLGAQINVEFVLFNYLKTTWSLGYAYLLVEPSNRGTKVGRPGGEWMFSLKLL